MSETSALPASSCSSMKAGWPLQSRAACVRTNVVTAAQVTGWTAADTTWFRPLVEATAENFTMEQVSAFLAIAVIVFKAFIGYWIIMWVKYTLMRIRIDHMLGFNWKFLTPLSFVLLMVTALMNALLAGTPALVIAALLGAPLHAPLAQQALEIIPLRHRTVEQVREQVQNIE